MSEQLVFVLTLSGAHQYNASTGPAIQRVFALPKERSPTFSAGANPEGSFSNICLFAPLYSERRGTQGQYHGLGADGDHHHGCGGKRGGGIPFRGQAGRRSACRRRGDGIDLSRAQRARHETGPVMKRGIVCVWSMSAFFHTHTSQ